MAMARDRGHGEIVSPERDAVVRGDLEFLRAAGDALRELGDDQGWLLRLALDGDRPDVLRRCWTWGWIRTRASG